MRVNGSGLTIAEPVTLNGSGPTGQGALRNLANNNIWSGAITLGSDSTIGSSAGTLTVSGAIATGGFVLTVDGAGNVTKTTGAISGTGGLTQTAAGTLTLSVANTYSGPTTVSAGTMKAGVVNVLANGSALTVDSGATYDLGGFSDTIGSLAGAGNVTTTGAASITLTSGGDNSSTSFSGVVHAGSGTLALAKSGTGTLTLSGANTYTGVTTVSAGVLRVQDSAALGGTAAGTTVASGAAMQVDGSGLVIAEPITSLTGTGILVTGALRNLGNANTWSGAITLAGTTRINSDGGTLTLSAGIGAGIRALTIGGDGNHVVDGITGTTATLTKDGAGDALISGVIGTTTGTVTKNGTGVLTLSAANVYTGVTTINAGTLRLGVADAVGPSSAMTVASGATFDMAGYNDTIGSLAGAGNVTSSAPGAVTLTTGAKNTSTSFSGVLSDGGGTLALVKEGTLIQTLSGANTYTGGTTINGGTLSIAADHALGTAPGSPTAGHLTFNGGTLLTTVNLTLDANRGIALTGPGTLNVNPSRTLTYGGVIDGAGTLTKAGTGTLTLSGANSHTGATLLTAGTLSIAADNALGTAPGSPTAGHLTFNGGTLLTTVNLTLDANRGIALTGPGTLNVNPGLTLTYGGVIDGAGTLTKAGTGTLTLSGANSHTGATTLTAGTLSIAADNALGTAPGSPTAGQLTFNGGILLATADVTINAYRGIALTAAGTFNVSSGLTVTYDGIVAGASTLTKSGAGTLVLSGANTYTGVTTVSAGVLRVQDSAALGGTAAGTTVASGAAIEIDGSGLLIAENITSLTGTGILVTGALRNLGNANTWSGAITLAGTTRINSDGGTLTISTAINANTRALTIGGDGNQVVNGITGTTATLTKDGGGTLTLSAAGTYTGVTTINAGTLSIDADDRLGTPPGTPTAGRLTFNGGTLQATSSFTLSTNRGIAVSSGGAAFDVATGMTLTYGGTATGAGGLTKSGDGTLNLGGATVTIGNFTMGAGTVAAPSASTFSVSGDWTNDASAGALNAGSGTVTLNGASGRSVGGAFPTSFNGLRINAPTGVTLTADIAVGGVLTFTAGNVTTGTQVLSIAPGGSVSRSSGHVVGNLRKHIPSGDPSATFEVGDATSFTPVAVTFAGVTSAGNVTVRTSTGDHPDIGSSSLDPALTANRSWSLANGGVVFASYGATFTFVSGDVDAGANTDDFLVQRFAIGAWSAEATGARTSTSTQATGLTGFGDFAVGVPRQSAVDHFVVTTPASATAGVAFDATVTAVDIAGNRVSSYTGTVTFSSSDEHASFAPPSYDFLAGDRGTKTFTGGVTLKTAGSRTVSVSGSSKVGTSQSITVNAGAFSKLQLLVPGETPDPGSPTGKTGSPSTQTALRAFNVTVNAVDAHWNVVGTVTDTVAVTSSDSDAILPADAALVAGTGVMTITLRTIGSHTVTASDVTDPGKSASTSPSITVESVTYTSDAGWPTSFARGRYLSFAMPAYVPAEAVVTGATFDHRYRSASPGTTTCYFFEVYSSVTLLATHGSPGSPASCTSGTAYQLDSFSLPEIDSVAKANSVVVRLYVQDSGGAQSQHNLATLGLDYYLP